MPNNIKVTNTKPNMRLVNGETVMYSESRSIVVGQPMGLLLTLTYPANINFVGPRI